MIHSEKLSRFVPNKLSSGDLVYKLILLNPVHLVLNFEINAYYMSYQIPAVINPDCDNELLIQFRDADEAIKFASDATFHVQYMSK